MSQPQKRSKHSYVTELELKCLMIRINNKRKNITNIYNNNKINKYVKLHEKLKNKKYKDDIKFEKRKRILKALKNKAIKLSEITLIDKKSHNIFGEKVLLMIKRYLTKPCFSGYTYKDEFYSDAVHKILKYMHNFDHTMISSRSGIESNAFAYLTQYIKNSILFIINTKNKEAKDIQKQVRFTNLDNEMNIKDEQSNNFSKFKTMFETVDKTEVILTMEDINGSLYETIKNYKNYDIIYPRDYKISMDEYVQLRELKTISIRREK